MKLFKRLDVIIIGVLLIVAIILAVVFMVNNKTDKKEAVIYKHGQEIYRIDLSSVSNSYELPLEDETGIRFLIENDGISFIESNCPNKICIKTGKILSNGQSAVCLPNQVYVKIESDEKQDIVIG